MTRRPTPIPPYPRLTLRRIEAKPKEVGDDLLRWHVRPTEQLEDELFELFQAIGAGGGIPEKFYRSGIDIDRDRLLEETGVMRLHLGGNWSDILLFLVQYKDRVELLVIGDHTWLQDRPPGARITALQSSRIRNIERDMRAADMKVAAASDTAERQAAADKAEKLRVALNKPRAKK